jgi:hypothetical protein
MGRDQGMSHRGKRAFTAVFLVVAIVTPACAQRRTAPMQGTAQNPGGSPRHSSGDDGMNGLDKAFRNAGIDGDTGTNIKTILKYSSDPNAYSAGLIESVNDLAKATDRQSTQQALLHVGGALAGTATSADYHIVASGNNPDSREELANALTGLLLKGEADKIFNNPHFTEKFQKEIIGEKNAGTDFRGWGGVFAKSIENSRAAGGAALVLTFETGSNPLYYSYTGAPSGAEPVTDKIDLIEANSNPGNAPDYRHLSLFFTSFNFEIRKARNQVPATLRNPFPSPYDLLAQDIAEEALKFSGPNLEALKKVTAELTVSATKADNGTTRNVTPEDVGRILEQLRHGSPPEAAQAKAALRAWLLESVDYQLRHPQAAAR